MRSTLGDSISLYGVLLGRSLTRTWRALVSPDGLKLLAIFALSGLTSVASCGLCSLPLFLLGAIFYPWMLGEVVRGSRLGWSDARAALRNWRAVLAASFVAGISMVGAIIVGQALGGVAASVPVLIVFLLPIPELLAMRTFDSAGELFEQAFGFLARNAAPWAVLNLLAWGLYVGLFSLIATVPAFAGLGLGLAAIFGEGDAGAMLGSLGAALLFAGVFVAFVVSMHVLLLLRCQAVVQLGDLTHRTRLFRYRSGAL